MQPTYSIEIEKQMQEVFDRLSEKDKRLYGDNAELGIKDIIRSTE